MVKMLKTRDTEQLQLNSQTFQQEKCVNFLQIKYILSAQPINSHSQVYLREIKNTET